MCSDPDSRPPLAPDPSAGARGGHTRLASSEGAPLEVYLAQGPRHTGAGVLVLPDYYGLTPFYEALAMRFAERGIDAVAIDYYGRTAPPPPRDEGFDHVAHSRRTTWAGLQADCAVAVDLLRRETAIERVYSIGFCFGGRTSFLLGTLPELALSGVVGFYGWPVGPFANDSPAPADVADQLVCPLLGIFGGADSKIGQHDVATFEQALAAASARHRIVSYDGAPHSFFDRARTGHEQAAAAAWSEVRSFVEGPWVSDSV